MTRVQIPAYTDRWMMGDRFGEIISTARVFRSQKQSIANKTRAQLLTTARFRELQEIAHVKLDKSGKTVRVILADCQVL